MNRRNVLQMVGIAPVATIAATGLLPPTPRPFTVTIHGHVTDNMRDDVSEWIKMHIRPGRDFSKPCVLLVPKDMRIELNNVPRNLPYPDIRTLEDGENVIARAVKIRKEFRG